MNDNTLLALEIAKAVMSAAMGVVAQHEGEAFASRMAAMDMALVMAAFASRRSFALPDAAAAAAAIGADAALLAAKAS